MDIAFGFAKEKMMVQVPDENLLGVLHAHAVEDDGKDGAAIVSESLKNPIDSLPLASLVSPGETVAIVTSDITRPLPSYVVLPPVLDELTRAGIRDEDITIVFGLGSHRAHTEEEMRSLVGDAVYDRVRCIDSIGEFIHMGESTRGTPYDVFADVVRADKRICLGNIEYHYFAGYSGGAKAIMPGVCTRDAIQANHSKMVEEAARAGALDDNPVRIDIDEVTNHISIDFLVNVILDEQKKIRHCVSGHWKAAHRAGCKLLDDMYLCPIESRADIVLVSPGGFPKDINLYQAQKALDNAKHAVKKGGIVILIGSCAEGLGEHVFEEWMTGHDKPGDMIGHIQRDFQLGGHKAAAIAMVLENARVFLVSDLDDEFVRSIHLEPWPNGQVAFDAARKALGEQATVLAMPHGGSTLPRAKQ